jgi:hypothetical protein
MRSQRQGAHVSEVILRQLWFVCLGVAAALVPARANASELQLQGMGLRDVVTIGGTSGVSGSYYAGEILWTWSAPIPGGFEENLYTYCVDILHEVENPQTVQTSNTSDPLMVTHATDGGAKAAWLLNTFAPAIHAGGTELEAAGLQVAIWEAISDNDHDLSTGYFTLLTAGAWTGATRAEAIRDQAQSYLDQLFYTADAYHTSTATWLDATTETGGGQDQIATPEPSSLVLLGAAGLFMRRRARKIA